MLYEIRYVSTTPVIEDSLLVHDANFNQVIRQMYQFTNKYLDVKDEKIQEEILKMIALSSDICYTKYVKDYDYLFLPYVISWNNDDVVLLKTRLSHFKRKKTVLVDMVKDKLLVAEFVGGWHESKSEENTGTEKD